MKLYYYKDPDNKINFGDDLNPWLWNNLYSDIFDNDADNIFVGIGTLLNNNIPVEPRKIVFSSGVGYGNNKPPVIDDLWKIYCVRGPLSAKALGLEINKGIIDGAYLLKNIVKSFPKKRYKFSYIPHFHSANSHYEALCERLGIKYINPSQSIENTLDDILSSEIIFCEAMHGAIVADCFNIPWVPIRTNNKILGFKWEDWCQSIDIKYSPVDIMPLWEGGKGVFHKTIHNFKVMNNIKVFSMLMKKGHKATFNGDEVLIDKKIKLLSESFEKLIDNEITVNLK